MKVLPIETYINVSKLEKDSRTCTLHVCILANIHEQGHNIVLYRYVCDLVANIFSFATHKIVAVKSTTDYDSLSVMFDLIIELKEKNEVFGTNTDISIFAVTKHIFRIRIQFNNSKESNKDSAQTLVDNIFKFFNFEKTAAYNLNNKSLFTVLVKDN